MRTEPETGDANESPDGAGDAAPPAASADATLPPDPHARARRIAFTLAFVSLGLNVASLIVPFLSIEVAFRGTDLYSLPRSVQLAFPLPFQHSRRIPGLVSL